MTAGRIQRTADLNEHSPAVTARRQDLRVGLRACTDVDSGGICHSEDVIDIDAIERQHQS